MKAPAYSPELLARHGLGGVKVFGVIALGLVTAFGLSKGSLLLGANSKPKTLTPEWKAAEKQSLKNQLADPITKRVR